MDRMLVMIVSCFVTVINMGLILSFGTLFLAMIETFHTDRSTAVVVQSLLMGMALGFGVLSGFLISRIGIKSVTFVSSVMVMAGLFSSFFASSIYYLYISIGVVTGMGISMAFISCLTLVAQIFTGTRRLYYISTINISISVGALIYPFLLQWLRESYGLHGTFLILSGVTCNTFTLFVVCFFHQEKDSTTVVRNETDYEICNDNEDRHARRNKVHLQTLFSIPFISLLIGLALSVGACNGFLQLMLDISIWKGLTAEQGLFSFVVFHSTGILSRLMPAVLNQSLNISAFICAVISALAGCSGQLVLYGTSGFLSHSVGIGLSSIFIGGILSSSLIIVVEIVRQDQRPLAYGILYTLNGLVSTTAGYSLGKARDVTGSYTCVLFTVGGMQLIAAILFSIGFINWKRRTSNIVMNKSSGCALNSSDGQEYDYELT